MFYLILLIFALSIEASYYLPEDFSKIYDNNKKLCESESELNCYEYDTSLRRSDVSVVPKIVDDLTKPNYEAKSNITLCDGIEDCYKKSDGLCDIDHFFVIKFDFTEVYCTKVVSYDQKEIQVIEEDTAKKLLRLGKETAIEKENNQHKENIDQLKSVLQSLDPLTMDQVKTLFKVLSRQAFGKDKAIRE